MSERARRQGAIAVLAIAAVAVLVWSWTAYREAQSAMWRAAEETQAAATAARMIRLASGHAQQQRLWSEPELIARIQNAAAAASLSPGTLRGLRPRRLTGAATDGRAAIDVTMEVSSLRQLGTWLQAIEATAGLRVASLRLHRLAEGSWAVQPVSVEYRPVERASMVQNRVTGG